jgi:uncharacterized protein YqjF (DUF2071 family)
MVKDQRAAQGGSAARRGKRRSRRHADVHTGDGAPRRDAFVPRRPTVPPAFHQRWENLLFLHWPIPVERLRPLVPSELDIDTFDGFAWVSMSPFWASRTRAHGLPAMPIVGDSHEVNLRTYVSAGEVAGVWFLSIDASNPLAVVGARLGFSLPYYFAWMSFEERGESFRFRSTRLHPCTPRAALDVQWTRGAALPTAPPGSRDYFLVERYCLYVLRSGRVCRGRIAHERWPIHAAEVHSFSSSILEPFGLEVSEAPVAHAQGHPLDVDIWTLENR